MTPPTRREEKGLTQGSPAGRRGRRGRRGVAAKLDAARMATSACRDGLLEAGEVVRERDIGDGVLARMELPRRRRRREGSGDDLVLEEIREEASSMHARLYVERMRGLRGRRGQNSVGGNEGGPWRLCGGVRRARRSVGGQGNTWMRGAHAGRCPTTTWTATQG
jgi:hypothetical protein